MEERPRIWAFADVDDTLITTVRQAPVEGSVPAAFDEGGAVCGWLTPSQSRFLEMLGDRVQVVLTTARTSIGVSRLQLPIRGYAIVSFGGVILLPDGSVEPRYRAMMASQCALAKASLAELLAFVRDACTECSINARARVVCDDGLDLFLSIKHNERNLEQLRLLRRLLADRLPDGWRLHLNGNFLAAMPPFVSKENAVRWFLDNVAGIEALAIGMGDSLTDLPFMQLCDFAVMPTRSQAFSKLTSTS
jgi:hydroxymethylpyrimidine pyrophosphatase-like HAD family hydrolase